MNNLAGTLRLITPNRNVNPVWAVALVATVLVVSGTSFSYFDLLWVSSLLAQALMGTGLVGRLTTPHCLPRSMQSLIGCLLGITVYSWAYQGVLRVTENPTATWLLTNLLMVGVAMSTRRYTILRCFNLHSNGIAENRWTPSVSEILGGGLLIAGLSEMRGLFSIGAGLLIAGLLGTRKETGQGSSSKVPQLVLATTFLASAAMAWKLDRPNGRFWMVSSNDLQTSLALSVSTSHFGFWDQSRFSGIRDTYHWAIYGWTGMSAPFSDQLVQVALLAPIVVCALLFWAIAVCIERSAVSLGIQRTTHNVTASATAASIFVASGLSSYTTLFGLLTVVCFSMLLPYAVSTNGRSRYQLLMVLILFAAVWSNALSTPFLILICLASALFSLTFSQSGSWRGLRRRITLYLYVISLGLVAWVVLYLPSARGGSFQLAPLHNRDSRYPELSRVLDFVNPAARSLILELFASQFLLLGLLGVGALGGLSMHRRFASVQGALAIGVGALFALLLFTGYEINKFRSWGTFATVALFGVLMISLLNAHSEEDRSPRKIIGIEVLIIGIFAFAVGLVHQVFQYLGRFYRLVEVLSLLPLAIVGCGLLVRLFFQVRLPNVLSLRTLIVASIFSFQLGGVIGYQIAESFQRYEISHLGSDVFRKTLVTDVSVETVAEFLRRATPRSALIASNFNCNDGETCPTEKLLTTDSDDLTPSIWGLQADMSNLAALAQRRFLLQSPRHVFGNYGMPKEAKKRWRLSGEFALTQGGRDELLNYGVDYFVLDWDSVPPGLRRTIAGTVYENSRFTIIALESRGIPG